MTTPFGVQRPSDPKLAKIFDRSLQRGLEVRYADETQVVVFQRRQWGCLGIILLILLGLLTAFIVPLILIVIGALSPSGQVTTYTLRPNGHMRVKRRAARG